MKKLFLVPTILSFAALPSQVKRMRDRAVALGVRLSGELLVTLSEGCDCRGNWWSLCRAWRLGGRRWLFLWNTQAEQL